MIQEDKRKEITKEKYRLIVWSCLIGGTILMSIFVYLSNFLIQENAYYVEFMALGQMILGVGIGLVWSRTFKIKDYDK
jgi:uncharacterized membrane protein YiaA